MASMIDRYLLRYFLAVVDEGGFSRAAARCRVTQPTLSVGIAKLERLLEARLFDRSGRRVALTPAGSRFAQHARRIEAEFAAAEREMRDDPAPGRTVRIGLLATLPPAAVERAVAAALSAAALTGERLEIVEARARELPVLLDRGRVDATIGPVAPGAAHAFYAEEFRVAVSAAHPLAARDRVSPADLAAETMLVRRHCEQLAETSRFFTGHGIRPRMAARTWSDAMALAYVRAGLAITVIPAGFAGPGLALLPLAGFPVRRTIGATGRADALAPGGVAMTLGEALAPV